MKSGNLNISNKIIAFALAASVLGGGAYLLKARGDKAIPSMRIDQEEKGGYTFYLNDKPFIIKGVCYNPIAIGKSYDFNFWGDPDKPWMEDGKLMKKMGVNTVRIYNDKEVD